MGHRYDYFVAGNSPVSAEEAARALGPSSLARRGARWAVLRDGEEVGSLTWVVAGSPGFIRALNGLTELRAARPSVGRLFAHVIDHARQVVSCETLLEGHRAEEQIRALDPLLSWLREHRPGVLVMDGTTAMWCHHDLLAAWGIDDPSEAGGDDLPGWCCAASGSAGRFSMDVSCSRDEREWTLSIDARSWALEVAIAGPGTIEALAAYFRDTLRAGTHRDVYRGAGVYRHMPEVSVDVGTVWGSAVVLLKCGECDDHYTLLTVGPAEAQGGLRLDLPGADVDDFVAAVGQLQAELAG